MATIAIQAALARVVALYDWLDFLSLVDNELPCYICISHDNEILIGDFLVVGGIFYVLELDRDFTIVVLVV